MTDSIISACDLVHVFASKSKGVADIRALDGLNLEIQAGELTALVGPDGAGKTTLMRLIAGLYQPSAGQLKVLGIDVAQDPQSVQDRISYMPQRFGLYEDLSVQENLDLYADLHAVPKDIQKQRFERLLAITDLTHFTQRPAGQLSGGMKQKLGLACALVRTPELLILDEPSVGVDPLSRRDLWGVIEQLVYEEHLTVIISTAYMDEAERCDQVYIMYEGKILKQGSPQQLCEDVKGLTWELKPPQEMKTRVLQAHLLRNTDYITDAVPKGNTVRFMTTPQHPVLPATALPEGVSAQAREAELEDAFMLILHQIQNQQDQTAIDHDVHLPSDNPAVKSEPDQSPAIMVKDVVRKFGDFTAVASTSFQVQRGEIFGLLGPNGAGKTTTFRMLCGLLPATSGMLEVAGMNLRNSRAQARARIGYVSQKFALYSNLTVLDNLQFFGGAYGLSGNKLKTRIDQALTQFHLKPHAKSGDLPEGHKKHLAIAAALLHEPEIIFLDEPTSGIDPIARRAFWAIIGELADQGITVIITTHFMEEAEYCDRIAIQDAGELLALGSPQQVRQFAGSDILDMNSAFIAIVEKARAAQKT